LPRMAAGRTNDDRARVDRAATVGAARRLAGLGVNLGLNR